MSSSSQEPEWTEPAGPVAAASDVASLLILADPKMKYVDRGEAYRPNRPVSFNPGRAERRLGLLCFLPCTFRHFRFLRLPQLEDSQRRRPINTSRAADNCGRKLQFAVSTLEPRFFYFSCSSHRGWVVHAHYNMQSRAAMAVIIIINCSYFVSPTTTDEVTNREKCAQ